MSERTFAHCRVSENDLSISRKHMYMFVRVMTTQNDDDDDESGRRRRREKEAIPTEKKIERRGRACVCVHIVLIQCVQE